MERDEIHALIAANMKNIFAFSLSRLGDASSAEDLSNDIIVELLRAYKNLRDDEAVYGFMWGVANNVYKRFLRKNRQHTAALNERFIGNIFANPEEALALEQQIAALRLELSLLSAQYRTVSVQYYIRDKSCSEISQDLNISIEMVKYYLFKARKIMKEGIVMSRMLGEKSYNPDVFRMDYWGTGPNDIYWELFKRKLPGNILLSAYYEPMTITELSLELGVAAVYLEDEIDILLEHEFLKRLQGGRIQTNIIIFTAEFENEVLRRNADIYGQMAKRIIEFLKEHQSEIREIGFTGSEAAANRFFWAVASQALLHGYNLTSVNKDFPLLSNGGRGYVYGYNREYDTGKFAGIDSAETLDIQAPQFTIVNYRVLNNPLSWEHHWRYHSTLIEVMEGNRSTDLESAYELIRSGLISAKEEKFYPNFPVYTRAQYRRLLEILTPLCDEIAGSIQKANAVATRILISHAPGALKRKCEPLAGVKCGMDTMAHIIECMLEEGFLFLPSDNQVLTSYGIVEDKPC